MAILFSTPKLHVVKSLKRPCCYVQKSLKRQKYGFFYNCCSPILINLQNLLYMLSQEQRNKKIYIYFFMRKEQQPYHEKKSVAFGL